MILKRDRCKILVSLLHLDGSDTIIVWKGLDDDDIHFYAFS
jgi:hypothetical protein